MLLDLGKRCGLHFDSASRQLIAEMCGDFPFWMRMACSHIHRGIDLSARPTPLTPATVGPLLEEFLTAEGGEITRVAIQNVRRVDFESFGVLREAAKGVSVSIAKGRIVAAYGLAVRKGI
jgi:hypothetical protein